MGLFNRGSKSDVPLNGDERSTNGASPRREATPEPTEAERAPTPSLAEPEAPVEETPGAEAAPSVPSPQSDPEPEPRAAARAGSRGRARRGDDAGAREAKPTPPVNRSEPEDGDDQRMSAEQALAPCAGPA